MQPEALSAVEPQTPSLQGMRGLSIRALIIGVVLLFVLPVWGYSLFVSWQFARSTRAALEADGVATARGLAASANFRVKALDGALRALSISEAARKGDLRELYDQATAFAQAQEVVVGLGDATGTQIFNTNAPFAAALPPILVEARHREAISTGKTQISDLIFGNVTKTWLLAITQPVERESGGRQAIVVAFDSQRHLGAVLDSVNLPEGWAVAIVDRTRRIAARKPDPDLVGSFSPQVLSPLIGTGYPGQMDGVTAKGESSLIFAQPVENTSWTVLVAIPEHVIAAEVHDNVAATLIVGFVIFLLSVSLSIYGANLFVRKFEALSQLALAFRNRAAQVEPRPYHIRELQDLQRTLLFAHAERDQSEDALRRLISDKELLMQEVHHRVKNSLQLVRGVLSLQARAMTNPEAKEALDKASSRIITIANVHHHLYQGESIAEIMVDDYLNHLTTQLGASLFPDSGGRRIRIKAPHIPVRTDAITSLGLITTELVTNSAKYGAGTIKVHFQVKTLPDGAKMGVLSVSDQGEGLPEDFSFAKTGGLGSRLIDNLVRGMNGTITIQKPPLGSRIVVEFPLRAFSDQVDTG